MKKFILLCLYLSFITISFNSCDQDSDNDSSIQSENEIKTGVFATFVEKNIVIERRTYITSKEYRVLETYEITSDLMYESTENGMTRLSFTGVNYTPPSTDAIFYLIYDSREYPELKINDLKKLMSDYYKVDNMLIKPRGQSTAKTVTPLTKFTVTESNGIVSYEFIDTEQKPNVYYYFNGTLKFKFAQ